MPNRIAGSRLLFRRFLPGLMMVVFVFTPFHLRAEETREDALALIAGIETEVESWTSDMVLLMNIQGMSITTEGTIAVRGNKLRNTMNLDLMGQNMTFLTVIGEDGMAWTDMDMMGQRIVMKMNIGQQGMGAGAMGGMTPGAGAAAIDPRKFAQALADNPDVVYMGRDELEGAEVMVFEMPIDPSLQAQMDPTGQLSQMGARPDRMQLMISPEDGFPRLWQLVDASKNPTISMIYRGLKLNPELSDDTFAYTPPPGVQVMDLSSMDASMLQGLAAGQGGLSGGQTLGEIEPEEEEAFDFEESQYNKKFAVGDVAPGFKAPSLGDGSIALEDYRGKVVLLDFWASWSEPYSKTVPTLQQLYQGYDRSRFEIIGVSLDEDGESARTFVFQREGMSWPQVFDGKGWSNAVAELYGVEAIPHTVLIGKDGVIAGVGLRGQALKDAVANLL